MTGSLSIGQCNQASGAAPTRSSFSYIVPPNQISNDASNSVPEDLPTPAKLSNAARDAKIKVLEVRLCYLCMYERISEAGVKFEEGKGSGRI